VIVRTHPENPAAAEEEGLQAQRARRMDVGVAEEKHAAQISRDGVTRWSGEKRTPDVERAPVSRRPLVYFFLAAAFFFAGAFFATDFFGAAFAATVFFLAAFFFAAMVFNFLYR
jgi:hypothetical protein